MLKTLFLFLFLPHVPSLQLVTSGPLPDTFILQLVESHRSDCWAGLKLGIPQVLPPPTVTAAASSSGLPHAPCSPRTSSSSSFSRSSSLGCGQTQRVSGSSGSLQLLSPPPPCQRTPQVLLRGGMARPLCRMGGRMSPSIGGPPPTVHHPNMLCPWPPSLFLPPAQDFCPTSSNTGPWAHKQKRREWSPARPWVLSFPPRCPPPAGSPWVPGRSQLHMVLRAPSSSPSFVRELHLQEGVLGTAVAQSVLPQPRETLRFRGRQHQTRKGRIDLWADVPALSGSPKPGQDALSYQPSSISSAPCAGLWQIQVLARVLVLGGNITPNEQ